MTISAVLIVRDEEVDLGFCLESVANVVDEIVVVDTGSKDRTVEIAHRFTNGVFHFDWIEDFSAARNFALEHATGDYILALDADQEVIESQSARARLEAFAAGHSPETMGTVQIHSAFFLRGKLQQGIEEAHRFFARGRYRYEGRIHEQLIPVAGSKETAPTGVSLVHKGYVFAPSSPLNKAHRNKRMLQRELAEHPDDEYYLYQLGRSHFCLEEFLEAADAFERAVASIAFRGNEIPRSRNGKPIAPTILADLLSLSAYAYVNTGQLVKARELLIAHEALGYPGTHTADFAHALGYVHLMAGDIARSRKAYEDSLAFGPATEIVRGTGSFASHYHLGLLCEADGNLPEAMTHLLQALCILPSYDAALSRCVDFVTEYRVVPPRQVWDLADRKALQEMYLERLRGFLAQNKNAEAQLLLNAAAGLSADLATACQAIVNTNLKTSR